MAGYGEDVAVARQAQHGPAVGIEHGERRLSLSAGQGLADAVLAREERPAAEIVEVELESGRFVRRAVELGQRRVSPGGPVVRRSERQGAGGIHADLPQDGERVGTVEPERACHLDELLLLGQQVGEPGLDHAPLVLPWPQRDRQRQREGTPGRQPVRRIGEGECSVLGDLDVTEVEGVEVDRNARDEGSVSRWPTLDPPCVRFLGHSYSPRS